MPEPSRESATNKRRGPVDVTYTKWVLPNTTLMEGFTGGDVPGDFVGEVLQRQVSQDYDPDPDVSTAGRITRLEAIYEAKAGSRSFTALIRGGQNSAGAAVLDGVILSGWRTGARVHVEFQRSLAPSPAESGCVGAPPGLNCFEGTIHIERAPEE
jgi:hypothetical protein